MIYPKNDSCPFNDDELIQKTDNSAETAKIPDNDCECNSCDKMLKQIQQLCFAVTDLNLYLDTHPEDQEALNLFTKLASTAKSLKSDYHLKCCPLHACESAPETPFQWVSKECKWPWQL